MLRGFFGSDRAHFEGWSHTLPPGETCTNPSPTLRSFHSFSQAAAENADSRVMAALHFRHASTSGTTHGLKIGRYVVRNYLEPTHH